MLSHQEKKKNRYKSIVANIKFQYAQWNETNNMTSTIELNQECFLQRLTNEDKESLTQITVARCERRPHLESASGRLDLIDVPKIIMIKWSFCSSTPKCANLSPGTSTFQSITDMNTSRYLLHRLQPFLPKSDYPKNVFFSKLCFQKKKKKFIRFLSCYARFWLRICRLILTRLVWCLVARGGKVSCELKLSDVRINWISDGAVEGVIADILRLMVGGWVNGKSFAQVFSSVRYIFAANTTFDRKKVIIRKTNGRRVGDEIDISLILSFCSVFESS